MISNAFEGELLLHYPKNRELLKCADFIGNIYKENNTNEALEALEVIADSQQINNESEPSAEENTDS